MKKVACLTFLCFIFVLFAGCVVSGPAMAPPSPKKIIRPLKPGANYIWISGHWKWSGGQYVWVSGHWTKPRPGKIWISGHWKKRGHRWVWTRGHWKKR